MLNNIKCVNIVQYSRKKSSDKLRESSSCLKKLDTVLSLPHVKKVSVLLMVSYRSHKSHFSAFQSRHSKEINWLLLKFYICENLKESAGGFLFKSPRQTLEIIARYWKIMAKLFSFFLSRSSENCIEFLTFAEKFKAFAAGQNNWKKIEFPKADVQMFHVMIISSFM